MFRVPLTPGISVCLIASTPSEDMASGDPMGLNKTGTLGPADKDRRSKKKCVSGNCGLFVFPVTVMFLLTI